MWVTVRPPGLFQVSLAHINYAVIFMVLILTLISNSSSLLSKPLETVPSAPTTIGNTITFMFHSFFKLSSKIQVFVYVFAFFIFNLWFAEKAKTSYFLILGLVFWIVMLSCSYFDDFTTKHNLVIFFFWGSLCWWSAAFSVGCPLSWGCRIHQLHLCRGVRPTQWVSCIWH